MSKNEIITKIQQLQEWEAILEDAKAEVEALKDTIKAEMDRNGLEELEAGTHIVRWTTVVTSRFDSTAFKKALPELYRQYQKSTTSRRFSIC